MKQVSILLFGFLLLSAGSSARSQSIATDQGLSESSNGRHFQDLISAGPMFGDNATLLCFRNIADFHVGGGWWAGPGLGMDFLAYDQGTWTFMPAFLDVRYLIDEENPGLALFANIGFSANPINYGERFGSGAMFACGAGIITPLWGKSKGEFDLAFRYQDNRGTYTQTASSITGLTLSIGFIP